MTFTVAMRLIMVTFFFFCGELWTFPEHLPQNLPIYLYLNTKTKPYKVLSIGWISDWQLIKFIPKITNSACNQISLVQ